MSPATTTSPAAGTTSCPSTTRMGHGRAQRAVRGRPGARAQVHAEPPVEEGSAGPSPDLTKL
jgi:hypothetical protein